VLSQALSEPEGAARLAIQTIRFEDEARPDVCSMLREAGSPTAFIR
jgi:hypothetical protein